LIANSAEKELVFEKMPHGKFVPFDADTDDQHKCTKSDTKNVSKKKLKIKNDYP